MWEGFGASYISMVRQWMDRQTEVASSQCHLISEQQGLPYNLYLIIILTMALHAHAHVLFGTLLLLIELSNIH